MVTIEINGKKLQVEPGSMIIEAADAAKIYIPRFCYHRKLSIAANCRMCLVDVEKSAKPLPACATPVTDGMKVFTSSKKAIDAQKAVMQFLLINHPLDCPICDQGGECELQDLAMGFGSDRSPFKEAKRSVEDDDLGSLIASDMTRCIHCTRCVRFGQEIAGIRELGVANRGEALNITTYVQRTLKSELSGNIIDLCPVGALTSKPFRFQARSWELQQHPSISPHDCAGSNIYVHTRRGTVMRVVERDNESINETWLSDRDRFSYLGLQTADRLTEPMIKVNGAWQDCDWTTAFEFALGGLQKIVHEQGPEQLGILAAPTATLEECYLLQKIGNGLSCFNIDHRIHQSDFSDQQNLPLFPGLSIPIREIAEQQAILLLGSNIQREQPILGHWVRQASLTQAEVMAVNPIAYDYYFDVKEQVTINPNEIPAFVAQITKVILSEKPLELSHEIKEKLALIEITPSAERVAKKLLITPKKLILLGALVNNHPEAATIRTLVQLIAKATEAKIGYLMEGPNAAGAWLAGVIPHRHALGRARTIVGLDFQSMITKPLKGYLFYGIEPELDCTMPSLVHKALKQAQFRMAFSLYKTDFWLENADVLLPIVPFTETSGTFVNAEGCWQSFKGVTQPLGAARPGWKVLRVLGNYLKLEGFEYLDTETIRDELKNLIEPELSQILRNQNLFENIHLTIPKQKLTRITEWPLYRADSLVRRSGALQECIGNDPFAVRCNQHTASQWGLVADTKHVFITQNEEKCKLPLMIDSRIPDGCVYIPAGYKETAGLSESFGSVEMVAAYD